MTSNEGQHPEQKPWDPPEKEPDTGGDRSVPEIEPIEPDPSDDVSTPGG